MGRTEKRRPVPPPPSEIVPAPATWPKRGEKTTCRHCGFRFVYFDRTRGLCKKVCFARLDIREKYAMGRPAATRCKCGKKIFRRFKSCIKCHLAKRKRQAVADCETEAELDALIESRRATMPRSDEYDGYGEGKHAYRPGIKVMRMDKRRKGFGTLV